MNTKFLRNCPICNKEITYRYKSDYTKASNKNSKCKNCANKNTQFQKGHKLNDNLVRKNSLNKLINDQSCQSFYWIGFIIADGSFYNSKFELGLAKKDLIVLEEFSKYINYQNKIIYNENNNSYRVSFSNSIDNPKFMSKYGFNFNKTYNPINFEIFENYSEDLLKSLLIGIIDGDGSINNNGSTGSFVISITSHKNWKDFYEKLLNKLNIPINIKDKNNIIIIKIGQRKYIDNLYNNIQNNNLFHLERKWNKINMITDPLV